MLKVYEVKVICGADFDSVSFHRFYRSESLAWIKGNEALAYCKAQDSAYAYSYALTVTPREVD